MKLLIELFGEEKSKKLVSTLKKDHPNMHEDWYVRQIVTSNNRG